MTDEELQAWHALLRDYQNPATLASYLRQGSKSSTATNKKTPDISEYV